MKTHLSVALVCLAILVLIVLRAAAGCGGDDLVVGGALPPTATAGSTTPTVTCAPVGAGCSFASDCCNGRCDSVFFQCF